MRWSIAARNAASVLPEPVGARTSTLSPSAIAGQASSCARVGVWKVASNHARVAGLNDASGWLPTTKAYAVPETLRRRCVAPGGQPRVQGGGGASPWTLSNPGLRVRLELVDLDVASHKWPTGHVELDGPGHGDLERIGSR